METVKFNEFEKVELRVGTIVKVEDFPEAKHPAYKITADFGEFGVKKSSSQLTKLYKKEDLLGKQIIGVINLPVKKVANFDSEFLVTGFVGDNDEVVIAIPERKVENGKKLA